MFVFCGSICFASEAAPASCWFEAACPTVWLPDPSHPHAPAWVCSVPWPVVFALPAAADEASEFPCGGGPPLPGLTAPTGAFPLRPASWRALESASAPCLLPAVCPVVWVPPPPCAWPADCVVPFAFPAAACEDALLVCDTDPSFP